jgi:uncharacterized protein YciI
MKGIPMKYYLLEGEHLVAFSELGDLVDEHHAFLQRGYDEGSFLFSGPQIPAEGGFLVARAKSRQDLDQLLSGEPFVREGKMRFSRITEFDPVQHQDSLKSWFGR